MAIGQYWVGQIPQKNLSIAVLDTYGRQVNCNTYTNVSVRMIGSNNEEIDLTGSVLNLGSRGLGLFVFEWPRDRSLFTEPGEYQLQLVLSAPLALDMTTAHTMRVRELGGNN